MQGFVLLGNGGHASSCRDIVESIRDYSISAGGRLRIAEVIEDTRVLTSEEWDDLVNHSPAFILGIGQIHDANPRMDAAWEIHKRGGRIATLISPFARVSPDSIIREGTVVMPGAVVNRGAVVGDCCILNTGCIVEHFANVQAFTHISTGAVINGDCIVGQRSFIGSNAVLLNQITVGHDITVGAGSVVTKNLSEKGIYCGNPAVFLKPKD
jgi:sugar O-acyltransferase (sialic acid O-acetyltransferase NeuD family)